MGGGNSKKPRDEQAKKLRDEQAKKERERQAKIERDKQAKISRNKRAINAKTYYELVQLGYEWTVAHEAAQKFPNDTFSAVDWIASQKKYNLQKIKPNKTQKSTEFKVS
eukprot:453393_1